MVLIKTDNTKLPPSSPRRRQSDAVKTKLKLKGIVLKIAHFNWKFDLGVGETSIILEHFQVWESVLWFSLRL